MMSELFDLPYETLTPELAANLRKGDLVYYVHEANGESFVYASGVFGRTEDPAIFSVFWNDTGGKSHYRFDENPAWIAVPLEEPCEWAHLFEISP